MSSDTVPLLLIAPFDTDRHCVVRATERIPIPETGVDLGGGFEVVDVSLSETWITMSEMAFPALRREESNRALPAKICGTNPNRPFADGKP